VTQTALLVFARCAGFAFRAPGVAHPSVPRALRGAFALFLAAAIAPTVRATARLSDLEVLAAIGLEFLLGSAIGIGASAVYDAAYAGGRTVDDYAGVKAIAPGITLVAPSGFGRVWSLAFTGAFFLLGAYRVVFLAFARSFEAVPPGAPFDASNWASFALSLAVTILGVAVAVAAPAIALAFLVQVALGALSRAVPRFGSLTLSFPLVMAAALLATVAALPALVRLAAHPTIWIP
jgi:flagellar biosynthetic protein FliR